MAQDSAMSILAVKAVPEGRHGVVPERKQVSMLGLTYNQRLPFGGLEALTGEKLSLRAYPIAEGLTLATVVISHADTKLLSLVFSELL